MASPSKKPSREISFVPNLGVEYQQNVPPVEWADLKCLGGDVEGVEGEDLYIYSLAEHEIRINARELYGMLRQHFAAKDSAPCESAGLWRSET